MTSVRILGWIGGITALLSPAVLAGPATQPAGTQLTLPGARPAHYQHYPTGNPAQPAQSQRRLSFGVLTNIGGGLEIGSAEDFDTRIDDILDRYEDLEQLLDTFMGGAPTTDDINALLALINSFEDDANQSVADLADNAYFKFNVQAIGPGAPLSIRSNLLGGVLTLGYDAFGEARAGLVSSAGGAFSLGLPTEITVGQSFDIIEIDGVQTIVIDGDQYQFQAADTAGIAIQGAFVTRVTGGYSREFFATPTGRFYAGANVHLYRVTLARAGRLLDNDEASVEDSDNVLDDNQNKSTGFGLDVGVLWAADTYSAGLTLRNLNEPSFDYPEPCLACDAQSYAFFTANPQALRNGSSWTMERQATVNGALYSQSGSWVLSGAWDLNKVVDSTGDEYQWLALGVGYHHPSSRWIPAPRLGYRRNLAGEELSYVNLGVSLLRGIHLDYGFALETTKFDDTKAQRAAQLNLGIYFEL